MSIETTWDLHCSSSPRSLSVNIAPPVPAQGSSASGGGGGNGGGNGNGGGFGTTSSSMAEAASAAAADATRNRPNNPFDDDSIKGKGNAGSFNNNNNNPTSTGNNPFEDAYDLASGGTGMMSSSTMSSGNARTRSRTSASTSTSTGTSSGIHTSAPSNPFSSSMMSSGYDVLIGTERGTLHHRTFPSNASNLSKPRNRPKRFVSNASYGSLVHPLGFDGTGSVNVNDGSKSANATEDGAGFKRSGNGSGTGSNRSSVHPLHRPIDTTTGKNCPIVACICAKHNDGVTNRSNASLADMSTYSHGHGHGHGLEESIYLILQDDKKSSSSSSSSSKNKKQSENEGAYSAKILSTHHLGIASTTASSSTLTIVKEKELPRMSCATYHPKCGYLFSAGSSIYSLPPPAVRAVALALHGSISGTAGTGSTTTTTTSFTNPSLLPSIYYNAVDILPSSVRSGDDSMACVCNGRVVVVAVGNAFYAVSGTNVPHGTWYTREEEGRSPMRGGAENAVSGVGFVDHGDDDDDDDDHDFNGEYLNKGHDFEKVLAFRQSSQVHPAIVVEIPISYRLEAELGGIGAGTGSSMDMEDEICTSLVFLASGRECGTVEILHNPRLYSNAGLLRSPNSSKDDPSDRMLKPSPSISCGSIVVGSPRHGIATLASPILAALGLQSTSTSRTGPLMAILTSDGLVHTRSPSCISIPLSTIEVGTRPNDYFTLRALPNNKAVAASYGGEARLISFKEDTVQDLADRMVKLAIDGLGSNGFPRSEFAEAVGATFSATSYVGPESNNAAKTVLRQYLEMILGLDVTGDFGGGDTNSYFFDEKYQGSGKDENGFHVGAASRSPHVSTYLSATALLCLVCTRLTPLNPTLANRAAKMCAGKLGVVSSITSSSINTHASDLCELVVQTLLMEAECKDSSNSTVSSRGTKSGIQIEMVEAATWLLRSCGKHGKAIDILQKRMTDPAIRNRTVGGGSSSEVSFAIGSPTSRRSRDGWSQLKFESFTATHLGELWSYGDDECRNIVLNSLATRRLLETNPMLGLNVFTASHPNNSEQWNDALSNADSFAPPGYTMKVVELLKSVHPRIPNDKRDKVVQINSPEYPSADTKLSLPLESGRALSATYLESLIGISSNRPQRIKSTSSVESSIHNELALLLLEGVLSERSDDKSDGDSELGSIYRSNLRRLLGWANAQVDPDTLMSALPTSFLRERALLLGQLGRHEDALRIFYEELKSLDLALEYCDARYEKQSAQKPLMKRSPSKVKQGIEDGSFGMDTGCAYLPLVAVVLECDGHTDQGIEAAIKVLSLRRENIDRAAALRLLPKTIPLSKLSSSFLVPALIDSESEGRRLTVVSSLLRAKYIRLKHKLTEAQIKSQSSLHRVPAFRSLNLDDPVYVSKSFKARPSNTTMPHFPDISLIKYFFPRYVIIQAMVTNSAAALEGKTLGDVQLIVAESSDEALLPSINVPIKTLSPNVVGSSWCALAASPQRLDGTAILACELRYRVLDIDTVTGAPLTFSGSFVSTGRSFVEEIQDVDIRRAEFMLDDL